MTTTTEKCKTLTPREREVMHQLAHGESCLQISERLHLSRHTIHEHVRRVVRKIGARSGRHAASLYLEFELMGEIVREQV